MAYSKLLEGDPKDFTPGQAGVAFTAEVNRVMREHGLDLSEAWKQVRALHPDVMARICEGAKDSVANSSTEQITRNALTKDYSAAFRAALVETKNDPIRAHAIVMQQMNLSSTPNLAERFTVKPIAGAQLKVTPGAAGTAKAAL